MDAFIVSSIVQWFRISASHAGDAGSTPAWGSWNSIFGVIWGNISYNYYCYKEFHEHIPQKIDFLLKFFHSIIKFYCMIFGTVDRFSSLIHYRVYGLLCSISMQHVIPLVRYEHFAYYNLMIPSESFKFCL